MLISPTARLGLETPHYQDETHVDPHISTSRGARTVGEDTRRGASGRSERLQRSFTLWVEFGSACSSQFSLRVALIAPSTTDLEPLASGISPTKTVFQRAAVPGGS